MERDLAVGVGSQLAAAVDVFDRKGVTTPPTRGSRGIRKSKPLIRESRPVERDLAVGVGSKLAAGVDVLDVAAPPEERLHVPIVLPPPRAFL